MANVGTIEYTVKVDTTELDRAIMRTQRFTKGQRLTADDLNRMSDRIESNRVAALPIVGVVAAAGLALAASPRRFSRRQLFGLRTKAHTHA